MVHFNKKIAIIPNFLLVVEDELRKSQIGVSASPKQPVKKGNSNGPPDLPPPRREDKPPPLPPLHTLPSRKNVGNTLSTPDASPKDHRPPKISTTERSGFPPKIKPYQPDRSKPDLPSKPSVSDKKPQLPPGRPALPERFANKASTTGGSRSRSSSGNNDTVSQPRPHQEQRKVNTMRPAVSSNKTPVTPSQITSPGSKIPLQPPGRPVPPGRPRMKKHPSVEKSTSATTNTLPESVDTGVDPNNPARIMEEINRISINLTEIAAEGLPVFNRALENFAQLSEQMLTLMQATGKSIIVTMKLREKVGQFRSLMDQINSNPMCDYTSQLDITVSEISKKFEGLYSKTFN